MYQILFYFVLQTSKNVKDSIECYFRVALCRFGMTFLSSVSFYCAAVSNFSLYYVDAEQNTGFLNLYLELEKCGFCLYLIKLMLKHGDVTNHQYQSMMNYFDFL